MAFFFYPRYHSQKHGNTKNRTTMKKWYLAYCKPKEEARARMHALLAQAAGQMHR